MFNALVIRASLAEESKANLYLRILFKAIFLLGLTQKGDDYTANNIEGLT